MTAAKPPIPNLVRRDMMEAVYRDLRALAQSYLHRERPGHTLQATELVHEAFTRFGARDGAFWSNREHFLAVAARVIRQVLVDSARRHKVRGKPESVEGVALPISFRSVGAVGVLELDEILKKLGHVSERHALVVELRCFGGLSRDSIATLLRVSPKTVSADWAFAEAWLRRELGA